MKTDGWKRTLYYISAKRPKRYAIMCRRQTPFGYSYGSFWPGSTCNIVANVVSSADPKAQLSGSKPSHWPGFEGGGETVAPSAEELFLASWSRSKSIHVAIEHGASNGGETVCTELTDGPLTIVMIVLCCWRSAQRKVSDPSFTTGPKDSRNLRLARDKSDSTLSDSTLPV